MSTAISDTLARWRAAEKAAIINGWYVFVLTFLGTFLITIGLGLIYFAVSA